MIQQAPATSALTAKKLTVTLGEVRPGFEAQVLGIAVDDQNIYATYYYNPIGAPKESLEPGKLFVLNKTDLSTIAQIEVGHQPRKVTLNPGKRRAYVTNYHQSSYSLSIVDLNARMEITQLKLGQVPIDVAINTRTNRIYVTNPTQQKMHVIDGNTNTELMSVDVGRGATGITVDESSGLIYVACTFRSAEPHVSRVVVIDGSTDTHSIVATLQIDPDGSQPWEVSVSGNRVYVGGLGGGTVKPAIAIFERNGATFTRLPDYPARAGVAGLDVNPRANLLYAVTAAWVQVFRTDTNSDVALIEVGRSLQGLAVDPSTGRVYVGHALDGAVSRLVPLPHEPQFNLEEDLGLIDEPVQISEGVWFLGKGIHPSKVRHVAPDNVSAADTTNTERLQDGGDLGLNLNGSGLTVGVWEANGDDGSWRIRDTHQEFSGRVSIDATDAQSDPDFGFSDHATHVAGTIGAAGVDRRARGMAGQINLLSYSAGDDINEMARDAAKLIASNHSYGPKPGWKTAIERSTVNADLVKNTDVWENDYSLSPTEDIDFGKYTAEAQKLDRMLAEKQNQHLLSVWSAGNERGDAFSNQHGDNTYVIHFSLDPNIPGFPWSQFGAGWYQVATNVVPPPNSDGNSGTGFDSIGGEKAAKNTLVVGAIQDITIDPYSSADIKISSFSSWGPLDDGRIKPDVVANGVDLYSAVEKSDTAYNLFQGTSMAAPNATGTAALLIQYHQNLFGTRPRSATIKGLLIHTAFDAIENPVAGGLPLVGPDYVYGWGLLDAAAAAIFLTQAHAANPTYLLAEDDYKGTEKTISIACEANQGPLKATLVWTDPAGTLPNSDLDDPTPTLVNDLNLWITGPDGTIYHPWTLDPQNPMNPAKRDRANHVDNVEQVVVDVPGKGTYEIHISHTGSLASPPQPYSLFITQEITNRKVLVDGKMFAKDDENGDDVFGETDVSGEMNVSASAPSSDSIYQELRVGGEVRVELRLSATLSTRNYVHVTGSAKLFEGTSTDTQDLEDEEPINLQIAPDAAIKHNIRLRNDGFGGGDTADIKLDLKNILRLDGVVDRVCPNRLPLNVGDLKIPYCSNKPLEQPDTTVQQAVIVLHGNGRNATGYYRYVLDAANKAGELNKTIIITPHFLTESDVNQRKPGNDVPFWTIDGWKGGDASLSTASNPRSSQVSSFEVVDIIVAKLADQNIFPNLNHLTFVGHSAGGQFVNRYAAAHQELVQTKYVVANPSSYLYMDQQRRVAGTLNQFSIPDTSTQEDCPTFNQYKYGLEDLNPYMQEVGVDQIRSQYAQRQVVYLLGEADNDPTPDEGDELDQTCPANLQGSQRLERGTIYLNYLNHFYGTAVLQGRHTIVTVPGVGHSASGMFNSPQGVTAIFG